MVLNHIFEYVWIERQGKFVKYHIHWPINLSISHSKLISQKPDIHMVHQIMLLHIERKSGYIATHITEMASLLGGTAEYAF